ncbi:MAG: hypothetical protein R3313_01080 [Candidatus Saccharimonadales bacterium]|nr:hypothetical protein [Candidatus Saccharimonadales bacterium]
MSDDQFTKLFKHMNKRFDEMSTKLDSKASQDSLDSLTRTIDGFVKRLDSNEVEQGARDLRFDRLLDWAREVSKKTLRRL